MTGTGRALARYLPAAALFVALIVAWQLAVTVLRIREYLLPAPLTVCARADGRRDPVAAAPRHHDARDRRRLRAGRRGAGSRSGVAIAWSPLLARALVPFLVFVNTLPKVAVAPLFLLWMGYGILPNMLIGALIGFFPVVINTAVGLTQVDEDMLDLGRVFNAPKWKVFAKIRIPNAYPYILSALKITATAAVVGAIVGEFVASQQGLGYVIVTTQSSMNTPVAFAALVWISVVGLALYGAVVLAARLDRAVGGNRGLKRRTRHATRVDDSLVLPRCSPRRARAGARRRRAVGPAAAQKVIFALNWFAVGDHAAYWVALDKGYYKASAASTWSCRTPRARATPSPRSTPAAPTSAWPTAPWSSPRWPAAPRSRWSAWCSTRRPLNIWSRKDSADHQAQGPRGQDAGRAARRRPAPDVPGLRQAERHRRRARSRG